MSLDLKSLLFNCLVPIMLSLIIMMLFPFDRVYYDSLVMPFKLSPFLFILFSSLAYIFLGLSGYFYEVSNNIKGLKIYYLAMIINLLLMPLFFYFKSVFLSIIILLILIIAIISFSISVYKVKKAGFYCLIPYFAWIALLMYLLIGMHFLA